MTMLALARYAKSSVNRLVQQAQAFKGHSASSLCSSGLGSRAFSAQAAKPVESQAKRRFGAPAVVTGVLAVAAASYVVAGAGESANAIHSTAK